MIDDRLLKDIGLLVGNVSLLVKDDPVPREWADLADKSGVLEGWRSQEKLTPLQIGILVKLASITNEEEVAGAILDILDTKVGSSAAINIAYTLIISDYSEIRELALEFLYEDYNSDCLDAAIILQHDECDYVSQLAARILKENN
ncbi:hypothetical protein [Aliikangiella sp. G2MR2-5]|uniref:hypothetical protein n=1 Tax=Aliikangiella sp. G2MR2-5 TaxID=2788943 RepID=UPI0018AAB0E9|nr:hypothetical protein [Aliikangiella sp. G2MR2-5]